MDVGSRWRCQMAWAVMLSCLNYVMLARLMYQLFCQHHLLMCVHPLPHCAGPGNRPHNRRLAAVHQSLSVSDQVPSSSGSSTVQPALLKYLGRYQLCGMPGAAGPSSLVVPAAMGTCFSSSMPVFREPTQQLNCKFSQCLVVHVVGDKTCCCNSILRTGISPKQSFVPLILWFGSAPGVDPFW